MYYGATGPRDMREAIQSAAQQAAIAAVDGAVRRQIQLQMEKLIKENARYLAAIVVDEMALMVKERIQLREDMDKQPPNT